MYSKGLETRPFHFLWKINVFPVRFVKIRLFSPSYNGSYQRLNRAGFPPSGSLIQTQKRLAEREYEGRFFRQR
ncbi:MAG: hypothetical protein WCX22_01620, partial [Methanoregula sp.]